MTHSSKLAVAVLSIVATTNSCKSRDSERSRLWSERTADDFGRLVTKGRVVAEIDHSATSRNGAALDAAPTIFAGVSAFRVESNPNGDTVVRAYFDTTKSPAIAANANLETEAQRILFASASTLSIDPTEIKLRSGTFTSSANWRIVRFGRAISGIEVRDSSLEVTFSNIKNTWRLAKISNRGWGHAVEAGAPQSKQLTPAELAAATGLNDVKIIGSGDQFVPKRITGQDVSLQRSNWYRVKSPDGREYTLTFSGASEPKLVEAFSHRVEETIQAEVYQRSWTTPTMLVPLADATYVGGSGGSTQSLDSQGSVTAPSSAGKIILTSAYAKVATSISSPGSEIGIKQSGSQWVLDVNSNNRPEVNAFSAISRVRAFAKKFLSDTDTEYFKKLVDVTTQLEGSCNAYYQDLTLNFLKAGGNCADMATVNDVVMHEWGHGLDEYTGPGASDGNGMSDNAFSEGIGDIVGMMYSGDSKTGVGFFTSKPNKELRNSDNTLVYDGTEGEMHIQGTIISGAFWELRRRLMNKYGAEKGANRAAELFFRHLLTTDTYLKSYESVQLLADDDNNPATNHPDFCIVNHAFAKKGLADKDPCIDDFDIGTGSTPQPTSGIYLAISGEDAVGVKFEASTTDTNVTSIVVCKGNSACTTADAQLEFKEIRGDRRIFGSTKGTAISNGQTMHVEARDAAGKVTSSINVKLSQK